MKTPLKSHTQVASMCLRKTLTVGPLEHPNCNKVKLLLFLALLGALMPFLLAGVFLGEAILSWGTQLVRLCQTLYLTLLINRHFTYFLKIPSRQDAQSCSGTALAAPEKSHHSTWPHHLPTHGSKNTDSKNDKNPFVGEQGKSYLWILSYMQNQTSHSIETSGDAKQHLPKIQHWI